MILTCSSCATRFLVDAAAIGPAGRSVRCARCQHSWFQEPAVDLPRSLQRPDAEAASTPSETRTRAGITPGGQPTPLRSGANLPAIPRKSRAMGSKLSWGILGGSVLLVLGSGYIFREQITLAWPPAAKLYSLMGLQTAIGNLQLADVSYSQAIQSGRPALTVKGTVRNDGNGEIALPPILVKLRNAAGRDIFQWTYPLPLASLAPGASLAFETILPDPPPEARSLDVTFAPAL